MSLLTTVFVKRRSALVVLLAAFSSACGARQEVVVSSIEERADSAEIDSDPWALFPPGAVSWARLSADKMFSASFGAEMATFLGEQLPISRDVGFDPSDHVTDVYAAAYATVGTDVALVLRGHFESGVIERGFRAQPLARTGETIVKRSFAGSEIYVAGGVAFSVQTTQTAVYGTELGVRRVLERIEMGTLERTLPAWFEDMLQQRADFCLGIDLDAQPVPATLRTKLSFLEGLRAARVLGNFENPGLNLAGTLTYDSAGSAERATKLMDEFGEAVDRYAVLFESLKLDRPLRRLETRALGKDAQVAIEVEGHAIAVLLSKAGQLSQEFAQ